nr:Ty3/gypsy retrotransposon protein [Tanacetum cinerariifolium]
MTSCDNIIPDPDVALELGKSIFLTEASEEEAARQVHATHARIVTECVPKPARRRPSGIALRDTSWVSKKVSFDPSQKLKGVQSLTPEEQEAVDTIQALKESKKTNRRQPGTEGSSEGTGRIPERIQESWLTDPSIQQVITSLQTNGNIGSKFTWLNDQLRRNGSLVIGSNASLRTKLLKYYHNEPMGGHSGVEATYKRLKAMFIGRE